MSVSEISIIVPAESSICVCRVVTDHLHEQLVVKHRSGMGPAQYSNFEFRSCPTWIFCLVKSWSPNYSSSQYVCDTTTMTVSRTRSPAILFHECIRSWKLRPLMLPVLVRRSFFPRSFLPQSRTARFFIPTSHITSIQCTNKYGGGRQTKTYSVLGLG